MLPKALACGSEMTSSQCWWPSAEVFHKHDAGFRQLILNVENRSTIRRNGQSATNARPVYIGDGNPFACCKVQKLHASLAPARFVEEIDPVRGKCPAPPIVPCRLIQNLHFLFAAQWHPPYTRGVKLRIIEKAAIG